MRRMSTLMLGVAALGAWTAAAARRQMRRAELSRRQLVALTDAAGSLARAVVLDDFLAGVLRAIAEQLDARWVMLFLHDAAQDELAVHLALKDGRLLPREQVAPNLVHPVPARDVPLWAELERVRRPIHFEAVGSDPRLREREALLAQGVRSLLVVPLFIGQTLIGWFSVRDTAPQRYRQDQLDLATALAQQAALAVQLRRLGEQGRQAAVLEERNRMAREIHDTLAQGFTGILMQIEATESALETARPELAIERLGRARELARASLAEARRSVWALRPEALEQQPFVEVLRSTAVKLTAGTSLHLAFAAEGSLGRLSAELEADLLRVAQEAIANSVRHAAAHTLVVRVVVDGDEVVLHVGDDGRGFDAAAGRPGDGSGFGLTAIRERVERYGGHVAIHSAPGQGTKVVVRVPRLAPSPREARLEQEQP